MGCVWVVCGVVCEVVEGCSTHPTQKWLEYVCISTVYSSVCRLGEILRRFMEVSGRLF